MRGELGRAYRTVCGVPPIPENGETVDVAVLDSVFKPPSADNIDVNRTIDRVEPENGEKAGLHGTIVSEIIYNYTEHVRFNFIRVMHADSDLTVRQRDLQWGIHLAEKHDMDVINMSLGNDHIKDGKHQCLDGSNPCKVRGMIEDHLSDDVVVITSAGNKGNDEHITCPGRSSRVITVGGMEVRCTADINSSGLGPSLDPRPPYACWVNSGNNTTNILCSGGDCSPFHDCNECRKVCESEINLETAVGKPDILAPSIYFKQFSKPPEEGTLPVLEGTSYAAPMVTALVAEIVSLLKQEDCSIHPHQMRDGISKSGLPVDEGNGKYLWGVGAMDYVMDRKGRDISITPPNFVEWNEAW